MARRRKFSVPITKGASYTFAESPVSTSKFGEIVTRDTAFDYYKTLGFLPNVDPVLKKLNKDVEVYDDLFADARVKAAFGSRQAGCTSLSYELDRMGTPARQYKVVESVLNTLPVTDIIAQMISAVWYGYQVSEVIWSRVGGMVLPTSVVPKPQRWFRFSEDNELVYLTKTHQTDGVKLPDHKFITARHSPSYGNPYGDPVAQACYWPVKFRHTGFRFFTQFIEKYGMPWIKTEYPLGARESRVIEMLDVLNKSVQDSVVAYPSEWKVDALPVGGSQKSEDIYAKFLDYCNTEIYMALLGQNLTSEVEGGSYAAAKVHGGVRQDLIEGDKRMVEAAFDTLIDWIFFYNFSGDARPEFHLIEAPRPSVEDSQVTSALYTAGVRFKKVYYQKHYGLSEDEFDLPEPVAPGTATPEVTVATDDQTIMDTANTAKDATQTPGVGNNG